MELPHIRMAARHWIRNFCVRDADGEPVLASFERHDGAPFDVRFVRKSEPQSVDEEGHLVDQPILRIFFNVEDLEEAGMTRPPDNRDRVVVEAARYVPAIVRRPSNGMVECQVQLTG
ncbi:MAG: hypothetical protein JWO56_2844 [Acidobacteria bacterium]|nr:hypothetical protein [Acidobacteriota bacterium]